MLFVAYIVLTGEYQQAVGSVTNQLESVATLKQNQINFWLNQVNAGANRTLVNVNGPAVELTIVSSEKLETSRSILNSILRQLTRVNDLFDETFVYTLNGEVLAASNEVRVGQRVTAQPYFQASLTGDYLQSPYYELGSSALTMVATRQIIDEDGRIAAVMAVRLNLDILGQIMAERAGLGETGETYLVSSESNYLLTPSRFEGYIQTRAYHSEGIDSVLTGQNGAGTYPGYRGESVVGVYKWIPELNAGLLAEINEDEALVSYYEAARASGWAMAIAGLAAAFTALYYANRVAKPIAALTRTAEQIAGGDLSQRAHIRSRNEIGLLAQAFNSMAEQLQEFIGSLENRVAARTRDLALTLEVGHLATSLYTQKDLLTSLVNFIRDQFDLYYTQIYLLDEAGLHAVLRAGTGEVGQQLLARNHRLNLSETSLVARAVQTNQPVLVADTQTSAIHKANPLLPDTRSEVTIPLVVGGVIIGVLDMQSNREGTFNQENLPVFEAMASQIASALRGSQAFEEAQAAIQRAEMVNRRLTEETWESYLGQLGEGRCLGYQYDLEAPRPLEPHSNGHDDGSRIVQPVFLRGQPIGKIVIAEDTERQWKPEEMLLVEDVAKRVAQALDQFRAFDQIKQAEAETRRRAAELQTVAEVSAATTTILNMDDLLLAVSDLTKERFNLYHAHIYLLDDLGENLVLAAGAGEAGRTMKAEGRSIRLDHPNSLVARAARDKQGVVVNDVTQTPDFLPNPLLPDTKAELAVPMLVGDQLIGVLDVQASVTDRFTSEDVRVQTTLAAQVAVAIQNARAFATAERRIRELTVVSDVSAQISTVLDTEALIHSVADLTTSGFGLYHLHIYLIDTTGQYLELAAGSGEVPCRQVGDGYRVEINDERHLAARAAKQRRSIINNQITQDVDFELNPNLPETRSQLVVPMITGDQVVGVLEVYADRVGGFTEEDALIQRTLAAQVAVAIQNARAFAEARRQATIIETSRDFISLADPQGTIVYLNTGGAKMIGYDNPAEIIGKPIPFVHFPEDSQRVQEEGLPKALETGYWQGENGLKHRDGRRIPVDQTIFVIRDEHGEIINIATIITDISERKQAQAVLEENEARFRSLVSNVPGIIYRCAIDEYWTMQFIGPAIADLTGYPDTDFIQNNVRSYASVIHPDDTAKVDEAVWRGVENRMPYEIEYRLVHADGTVRWVNERGQAVYGQDGTPLWLDGAVFDITESKRAEVEREQLLAEMQRNARLIRTVIDATPDWIFAKDRDYRYILANQGYANAIGTTTDGIVGKTDVELGFPEEIVFGNPDKGIRGFRSDDEAVLTTGESIYNPYDPATFADGSIHIFDTQKMPLRDAAGHTFAVLGFARDITLRQQQEEEVRLAREEAEILYKVSSAINEAKNPLDIVDAILAHAAPPVEPSVAVTNNDTGDSTTARYVNILAGRLSDGRTISNMRIALDDFGGGFSTPNELRCIADIQTDPSLTEEARWSYRALNAASVLSAPLEIGGRVIGTLSITTGQPYHYTERDRRIYTAIAEQVAAAMERLQLIQETQKRATEMETVARVSAATTTILDVEELLQAVCDLTKERFRLYHTHIYLLDETGQKLTLAAGAGDAGRIMKAEGRFIPINHPNSLVARAARERRGIIANDVTQEPDFLANPLLPLTQSELAVPMIVASELIGVLDVQSEILSRFTEEDVRIKTTLADQVSIAIQNARAFRVQQEAAERLREVDRLKSQFLANMSHELRTPLNSIIGYAEVMLDGIDGELTDDAIEDVEAIHSGGKHLLAIINDILDLAKIDAGQMFMDRQEADLGKIIEEVVHTCQILVKDKGIYLELERQAELPPVYGDPVRLRQIVYNLVNNAIKFTEKGGITVSIGRQDDQQICVTVKDTGIGMSQKDLSVIFERFRQVDGSATRRAGGTGLGLAITRQLVQMHDGEIHVTSKPHEGSTFWFTLPVYEGQKA
ncbi:MAG: hypothetical protein BroJett038_04100 [Chloroflexota bacterium]|nr:MAG: hypothetical protein BroJett038_04100 [Chloroflexota bacterium]